MAAVSGAAVETSGEALAVESYSNLGANGRKNGQVSYKTEIQVGAEVLARLLRERMVPGKAEWIAKACETCGVPVRTVQNAYVADPVGWRARNVPMVRAGEVEAVTTARPPVPLNLDDAEQNVNLRQLVALNVLRRGPARRASVSDTGRHLVQFDSIRSLKARGFVTVEDGKARSTETGGNLARKFPKDIDVRHGEQDLSLRAVMALSILECGDAPTSNRNDVTPDHRTVHANSMAGLCSKGLVEIRAGRRYKERVASITPAGRDLVRRVVGTLPA